MEVIHGFECLRSRYIEELQTRADFYRHLKTGAELLSLVNSDENKVFGITFRTPPADLTGVAHVLEHSVLCGSRKYPVKEPFVELMKGSLHTFLNAFTYPDKTCYPVASQNLQDLYNLIDVYLDAVFYPRLTPHTLQQEGWHLEVSEPDKTLAYKGVVFNEMKGAYSSPDRLLIEYSQQSLFPGHIYALDSGGEPGHIPELTFAQLQSFHQRYYHPGNARIFFYGDDDPAERLRLINDYLKDFEPRQVESVIPPPRLLHHPRRFVRSYAAGPAGRDKPKGMITVNWLLCETAEAATNMALRMLEYILVGMPGSPLRRALIESGLGEDIAGIGLEDELRHLYFSTGLKGIDVHDAERIESLVLQTLGNLATEGIDALTVEAAVNTIEFRFRENSPGHYPRGLLLMLRALSTWLYDADPLALLAFARPLEAVKARLATDPSFFARMLERFFLDNPHRTTVILQPDAALAHKAEAKERQRLAAVRASMTPEALEAVIDNSRHLKRLQETPDPPEALARIPSLKLADLERKNKIIPLTVIPLEETRVLCHELPTNGILYLDIGLDLHALPQRYLPYVPLFGRGLIELGTEKEDFVRLTQRISCKTGGIRPQPLAAAIRENQGSTAWLFLRGKAMLPQSNELLAIVQNVLLTTRLDNRQRFRQMVLEEKARQEQRLIPEGHKVVDLRLRAHFSEADWAAELMKGVSYLFFLRQLADRVERQWQEVLVDLEEIRRLLVKRQNLLVNVTTETEVWPEIESLLTEFLQALPSAVSEPQGWRPEQLPGFEAMTIPAQVNYVGKGANLYRLGYRLHGSARVISRYLRTSWLWEKVRLQGGAYGAFCRFNHLSGALTFLSYRDPNFRETLKAFDQACHFLRRVELNPEELSKSIIGTIGEIDAYLLPDARGYASMLYHLTGDSEEKRQQLREEILATTTAHFRAFADVLDGVKERGLVKVLGPPGVAEEAAAVAAARLQVLKLL